MGVVKDFRLKVNGYRYKETASLKRREVSGEKGTSAVQSLQFLNRAVVLVGG